MVSHLDSQEGTAIFLVNILEESHFPLEVFCVYIQVDLPFVKSPMSIRETHQYLPNRFLFLHNSLGPGAKAVNAERFMQRHPDK